MFVGSSSFQNTDVVPDGRFQIYGPNLPWNTFGGGSQGNIHLDLNEIVELESFYS